MAAERPSRTPGVAVDVLRAAVAEHAAASSIRQLAGEIGVGVTTLWQFLEGAEPQLRTRRRLTDWYLASHAADDAAPPDAALAAAALALLTRHMPPSERRDAERRLLRVLERASGELAPEWLARLRPDR